MKKLLWKNSINESKSKKIVHEQEPVATTSNTKIETQLGSIVVLPKLKSLEIDLSQFNPPSNFLNIPHVEQEVFIQLL
jgi:hypothetical protein